MKVRRFSRLLVQRAYPLSYPKLRVSMRYPFQMSTLHIRFASSKVQAMSKHNESEYTFATFLD
jgi:hypothetical protein